MRPNPVRKDSCSRATNSKTLVGGKIHITVGFSVIFAEKLSLLCLFIEQLLEQMTHSNNYDLLNKLLYAQNWTVRFWSVKHQWRNNSVPLSLKDKHNLPSW